LIKKTSQHILSLLCQRKRKCWRCRWQSNESLKVVKKAKKNAVKQQKIFRRISYGKQSLEVSPFLRS